MLRAIFVVLMLISTSAIFVVLMLISTSSIAGEFEKFDLPESRAFFDIGVIHRALPGHPDETAAGAKFTFQQRVSPTTALEFKMRGGFDVDENRYVGTEFTLGLRKQLF
jgi:predicted component of viral defense system (DUF524 family)